MKSINLNLGLAVLAVIATLYGGSKAVQQVSFRFEGGLHDAGSSSSGNLVTARWSYEDEVRFDVFKWQWRYPRLVDSTGQEHAGEWHSLPDELVLNGRATAVIEPHEGGIEIVCWAVHTVGPTVVTNGVYHLSNVMHPMTGDPEKWITPATPIKADDKYLSGDHKPPVINIPTELIERFLED